MFDSNEEKTDDLELTDLVKYERKDQQKLLTDLMDKITEDLNVPFNFSLATICHGLLDNYDLSKVGLKNFENQKVLRKFQPFQVNFFNSKNFNPLIKG